MRIVAAIPHPHCIVNIYLYNEKYIVKMEFGNCAIEYKIKTNEVSGLDEIKKKLNPEFIESFAEIFTALNRKMKIN